MLLKSQYSSFKNNSNLATQNLNSIYFQNTSLQASLPSLSDQIHINLTAVRVEMKNYDEGPPLELERIGPYFSKKMLEFSDHISDLCRTGESSSGNLYSLLRPIFQKWECLLSDSKALFRESVNEMTENYDVAHRGRELVTFSDYCVYESLVKTHVGDLKQPAQETMRLVRGIVQKEFRVMCEVCFPNFPHLRHIIFNKIDDIQTKQESKAEKRIHEYINMEKLVYTQDPIFNQKIVDFKFVERRQEYETISLDMGVNATSPNNCAVFDTRKLTPEKLIIYYEIVYQRLADHIPMVILLFILKESAVMLRAHAMDLRDGADVVKLLVEDSDAGRQRIELYQRMERLRLAQERVSVYL